MAIKAKGDKAAAPQAAEPVADEASAAPNKPARPRKTAAARVATKTARAAKRQAKKSGKPVPAAAAPAAPAKKPALPSGARTTSAAKRKAAASAKAGILSRSIGGIRTVFSGAASRLSALVRPKKPQG